MANIIKNEPLNRETVNKSGKKIMPFSKTFKINSRIVDEDSAKGRFGWAQIMTNDLPYLFRNDGKYCCFRMLEQRILTKLFSKHYRELVTCVNVKYTKVTRIEAGLLNEINSNHCNFQFGKERFATEDVLLKLSDAGQLCGFLHYCYLLLETPRGIDSSKRCGFVRINKDSVVPYSTISDQKCLPLFYFEGETNDLKQYTFKLENWELAYLKFCCKIQGIRNDLITGSWSQVICLKDLKSFFPPNTIFEEYWPARAEPNRNPKQKADKITHSLNTIYNMAINTLTPYIPVKSVQQKIQIQPSPSKTTVQKFIALQPKFINIRNDPTAPSPNGICMEYSNPVYQLQHVMVEGKVIVCINMKPNDNNDKWVPVWDLSSDFFYRIPIDVCEQVLNVLGIKIYKANTAQMRILKTLGRYTTNEVLSLVQVDQVIQYLPQLTYMIRNILCKSQSTTVEQ